MGEKKKLRATVEVVDPFELTNMIICKLKRQELRMSLWGRETIKGRAEG